jgi:small subunit ribosomal protein S16
MSVSIRLSRGGSKKRPYYKLVVSNSRAPRDGKYLEQLGTYNPLLAKDDENRVRLIEDRVRYWLGVGAQPTDRVARMLDKAGIKERVATNNPNKGEPGQKAKDRVEDKAKKLVEAEEAAAAAAAAPPPEPVVEEVVEEVAAEEVSAAEVADATQPEVPAEEPAEIPAPAPEESPAEAPAETPTEAPAEVPAESPAEVPAEPPVETPPAPEVANEATPNSDAGDEPAAASGESAQDNAEG